MTNFETRHLHSYSGSDELPKLLQFVGKCNVLADYCGCLHPGDICHFQRLGLTRALMYEGMRRMSAHGMTTAVVKHKPAQQSPAAAALYRSTGFSLRYTLSDYRKQIM